MMQSKGQLNWQVLINIQSENCLYIEDPYTRLLSQLGGEIKMRILKNELGESARYFKMVEEIRELSGIQARLPYFIEIR